MKGKKTEEKKRGTTKKTAIIIACICGGVFFLFIICMFVLPLAFVTYSAKKVAPDIKNKAQKIIDKAEETEKENEEYKTFLTSGFITREVNVDYFDFDYSILSGYVFTKNGNYYYQSDFYNDIYNKVDNLGMLLSEIGTYKIKNNKLYLYTQYREIIKDQKIQIIKHDEDKVMKLGEVDNDSLIIKTPGADLMFEYSWYKEEEPIYSYDLSKQYDIKKMKQLADNGYNNKSSFEILGYKHFLVTVENNDVCIFKEGKLINCFDYLADYQISSLNKDDHYLILSNGIQSGYPGEGADEIIVVDYYKGKVLSVKDVQNLYESVLRKNSKYYIINSNFKLQEIPIHEISKTCYEGCWLDYVGDNKLVVIDNNKKFGIFNIKSNKYDLEPKYEDILLMRTRFYDTYDKYFIAKESGKWNLVKIDDYKQITKNGYDRIYVIDDNIFLVYKDKELRVIDTNEKDLIKDSLKIELKKGYVFNGTNHYFEGALTCQMV